MSDPGVAAVVAEAARQVVGSDQVIAVEPMMIGQDFAFFLPRRPGCFFLLGGSPAEGSGVDHTETFEGDEARLPVGLEVMARRAGALRT